MQKNGDTTNRGDFKDSESIGLDEKWDIGGAGRSI